MHGRPQRPSSVRTICKWGRLKSQWDLFNDQLGHPKQPVTVLMIYCRYAVIYRRNPVGLPVPSALMHIKQAAELNRLLHELAWDAVIHHPLSGVKAAVPSAHSASSEE